MVFHVVFLMHVTCKFDEEERYYDEDYEAYEALIALLFPLLVLVLCELARLDCDPVMRLDPKVLLAEIGKVEGTKR